MSALQTAVVHALVPPSRETLDKIEAVNQALLKVADVEIATEHVLHGGMYARTIRLAAGVVMAGAIIKQPTILIISGSTSMLAGDERIDIDGYNVLPGCTGRQGLFVTRGPVEMTMLYATHAKTVEEAENELCDADQLMSRRDGSNDTFTITGE